MNPEEARAFGALVKARREALGMTRQRLAAAIGVRDSTITRLERGGFAAPRPDKLARLAEQLDWDLGDVFAEVGYVVPKGLPGWRQYLKTKYPKLPDTAVEELTAAFLDIAVRYNVAVDDAQPASMTGGKHRPVRPNARELAEDFGPDFKEQ